MFAFCGGPLLVGEELKPALGSTGSLVVTFAPVCALLFGALALRDGERDAIDRVCLVAGTIGAVVLLVANVYAQLRLLGGYDRADAGLIQFGIGVGTLAALVYVRSACSTRR